MVTYTYKWTHLEQEEKLCSRKMYGEQWKKQTTGYDMKSAGKVYWTARKNNGKCHTCEETWHCNVMVKIVGYKKVAL